MYQYIEKGAFDTVICTHVLAAIMLTHVQKTFSLALKTALIMTDYTCHPGMEATDMQIYFIPDESLTEEFVEGGIPREKIVAAGIPVCKSFYKNVEKADAKRLLDIRAEHKHLLVMCGSMGCGPMEKMVRRLCQNFVRGYGSIGYLRNQSETAEKTGKKVCGYNEYSHCRVYETDVSLHGFGRSLPDETGRPEHHRGGGEETANGICQCGSGVRAI